MHNKSTIQRSFAISAGAGSGKTYTLSRRFINILLGFDFFIETPDQGHFYDDRKRRQADLDQIVTITYTEAAALEMKERIFGLVHKILSFSTLSEQDSDHGSIAMAFEGLGAEAEAYITARLSKAQQEIAEANITTIHGFCLNILKRHSDVAKIDGRLDVLDDDMKAKTFDEVYLKIVDSEAYRKDILDVARHVSLFKSRSLIERYVFEHKFRESFDHYVHGNQKAIKELLASTLLAPLEEEIALAYKELDEDKRSNAFHAFVQSFYDFRPDKYTSFAETMGAPKTFGKKYPETDSVKKSLDNLMGYFSEIDVAKERRFVEINERFRRLLNAIKQAYDEVLKEKNGTDFDTIIQQAAQIIPKVETDYRYIMVDEFQDTNALQWEIIKEAAKGKANLFVVGDEKQSIYSFQGGEIEVFHNAIAEQFDGDPVQMSDNYRSDREIIAFVNRLFSSIFETSDPVLTERRVIVHDFEARPQALVSKSKEDGNVSFLVTREGIEETEEDNLAQFIKSVVEGERHSDLTALIKEKKQAIAVLYDAKSKLLALRDALLRLGVECKVSASEDYYHTTEITDLFFVLKALAIMRNKKTMQELTPTQKFFVVGAMRSAIMHFTDKEIHEALQDEQITPWFIPWIEKAATMPIHTLVASLLSTSDAYSAYASKGEYEQRLANIDKFMTELISFENSEGYDLDGLTHQLEQRIFRSDAQEDEAFYRSSTGGSIELCSIHSTKGLAYPMVILADSAKRLTSQVTSESIKFNRLKDSHDETYDLIGFKVEEYDPLSLRLLKEIDRRKHMAEKRRLFYVALTRPEHHLVISANLKVTKNGVGSISDSYLEMTLDALDLTKEALFEGDGSPNEYDFIYKDDLTTYPDQTVSTTFTIVDPMTPISFTKRETKRATAKDADENTERDEALEHAALRGTLVHKAIELFWDSLDDDKRFEQFFLREDITDTPLQEEIKSLARNFQSTDVYRQLQAGVEHLFEFGFEEEIDGELHRGSVDLLLKDQDSDSWMIIDLKSGKERESEDYKAQLAFYRRVMEHKGLAIASTELCWLG